mmetsp:Transcript_118003/g.369037  ORF Transcript_118003/g.369037 Transcript_118003/m.369037 type:complete len:372 (+) Transcript_118003:76-1191(+)
MEASGLWQSLLVRERNTFIEVRPTGQVEETMRRVNSEPSIVSDTSSNVNMVSNADLSVSGSMGPPPPPSAGESRARSSAGGTERDAWRDGCLYKYLGKGCNVPGCRRFHDLTPEEVSLLVARSWQEQHVLFSSSNDTSSSGVLWTEKTNSGLLSAGAAGKTWSFNATREADEEAGDNTSEASEDELAATSPAPRGPSRLELLHGLEALAASMREEQLRAFVPVDPDGQPTSLGSALHDRGKCKPCISGEDGCAAGLRCQFCHLPHGSSKKKRNKPCKAKRESYRRLVNHITQAIEDDPEGFDPGSIEVLPSMMNNDVLKRKLMRRIETHMDSVRTQRATTPALPSGPGSAPPTAGSVLRTSSGRSPHIVSL